ncbi:MAG TPA: hypothetical protein VM533_08410 [Fimbriiglobus sp.]|jgi:hypothetical protein|nr:hypothetical protein [Fimbriiglobus sp.]
MKRPDSAPDIAEVRRLLAEREEARARLDRLWNDPRIAARAREIYAELTAPRTATEFVLHGRNPDSLSDLARVEAIERAAAEFLGAK